MRVSKGDGTRDKIPPCPYAMSIAKLNIDRPLSWEGSLCVIV